MQTLTMKFGGTSVGSPEAIATVCNIVKTAAADSGVIVVVSAMSKVTDLLVSLVQDATTENRWAYRNGARKLRDRHSEVLNLLMSPGLDREAVASDIGELLDQLVEACSAVSILGEASPRVTDQIVSYGERMSARMIAGVLREQGVKARAFDAGEFLITDDRYQQATPLWDKTQANIDEKLKPLLADGVVPVITGFLGATEDGRITTLGRGGSDYSAAIFAAAVNADELIIWTDVDGVMTADPRIDGRARVLPYVSYQEVGELAFYGAKVLHPKTVQPILNKGIPMRVCNTFNAEAPGTLITEQVEPSATVVKAVTSVRAVSLLTVSGRGMIGVPGIAGRTFLATAQAGANILMISQASSEQNFCFVVLDDNADAARIAIEDELVAEIARRDVDSVNVMSDVAIVTVVGAGMRGIPGVAGRVFSAMGNNRVNVIAIAQGASEVSISFVVQEDSLEQAVITLHDLALEAVPAD